MAYCERVFKQINEITRHFEWNKNPKKSSEKMGNHIFREKKERTKKSALTKAEILSLNHNRTNNGNDYYHRITLEALQRGGTNQSVDITHPKLRN